MAEYRLARAEDVFALRQGGRVAAAAIGCDEPDQVRLATALSELGREALAHGAGSFAVFSVTDEGSLWVDIERFPRPAAFSGNVLSGLDASRKLLDTVTRDAENGLCTVSVRLRGVHALGRTRANSAKVRDALARGGAPGPLDELRLENQNLIATLQELTDQQEQLVRLNAELEETNRGVMAMYAQLADELEETNRGVVALYAELDDKTLQLNAASDSKSRFLASVSHELRGPLNSILGLGRLLLDPQSGTLTEDQNKELQLMSRSAGELLKLVNELLDLAKAESGRLQPEVARLDLAEVFSDLRGSLRPLVRPDVELQVEMPVETAIETDRVLLMQILRNLLTNALKFTTTGSVRLSASHVTPYELEISVTDTGIGIDPAHHTRVFEEFFQVPGSLQAHHKGSGLGLPYARRVTQTLGGHLRLESAPGRGSVFRLTLPAAWQPLLSARESPGRAAPADSKAITVLIIDDDEGFRTVLRGMLQGEAGQIFEARGGVEGLSLMRNTRPDLVFLDLRMPDLDGTSVLLEMKSDPELRDIPVIVITSVALRAGSHPNLGLAAALLSKSNMQRDSIQVALREALRSTGAAK